MMAGGMTANQPPIVYDVINSQGRLFQRVTLPPGRQIVGFGRAGTIYLQAREGRSVFIETVKLQ